MLMKINENSRMINGQLMRSLTTESIRRSCRRHAIKLGDSEFKFLCNKAVKRLRESVRSISNGSSGSAVRYMYHESDVKYMLEHFENIKYDLNSI